MKLTDLAMYFHIFLLCLLTVLHVRSERLHAETVNNIMYDNVMDGIVEDSLSAGYQSVDRYGKPIVNLDELLRCFEAEKRLYGSEDRHILIYVEEGGYYIWDSDREAKWSDRIDFSDDGNMAHEAKIYQLVSFIENNYGVMLTIPSNDGESIMNTVSEYSLIGMSFNKNSSVKSFSGARIHKDR